tara:strand:+ start:2314 stop:2598 length:285 start_codon:yes stop_codon:yes gene_type:complete
MLDGIPTQNIENAEFQHAFLSFCTLVSLLNGKKMNYPTVFLKILENKKLREIYMQHINEDSEFVAISKFIQAEPSITKSKYITKYLNKLKTPLL